MYRTLRKITVERKTLGEKCLKQSSNNKNNQLENYFVNFFNQKSLQSFTWKTPNNLCLGVITWRVGYFCGDLSPSKSSLFFDRNLICFLQSYMNSALTAQKTIFFVVDSPQNQGRWLEKNSHLPGPSSTKQTPPKSSPLLVSHQRAFLLGLPAPLAQPWKQLLAPHEISLFSHVDTDVKSPPVATRFAGVSPSTSMSAGPCRASEALEVWRCGWRYCYVRFGWYLMFFNWLAVHRRMYSV